VRDVCERGIVLDRGSVAFDGEKQQAIRVYLRGPGSLVGPEPEPVGKESVAVSQPHKRPLKEPFWSADPEREMSTRFLALGIYDEQLDPRSSFKMTSPATVVLHMKTTEPVAPHLHIEIKNKHDQIVTSLGTLGMGISRPATGTEGELHFSFTLKLSIEAGNYSLRAYIVTPSADGTTGEVVDETPWLGPVQVFWNYEEELPPFAGMFGMECTGAYE
jgi:lipopolysaccharide transport system ATP-binding protein